MGLIYRSKKNFRKFYAIGLCKTSSSKPAAMKKIYIQVPEPCHEDWSKMTKAEKGRYCDSCCKEVVDFSIMTDREILNYLSKPRGKTCGNFLPDQLNRAISEPQPPSRKWGWGVMFSFLITLAGACKQRTIGKMSVHPEDTKEAKQELIVGAMVAYVQPVSTETVIDSTSIKGEIAPRILEDPAVPIEPGPEPTPLEELVPRDMTCNFDIDSIDGLQMETALIGTVGGVSFVGDEIVEDVPTRIIDTIKNIFISPEIKLYPNPASKGSRVNVKVNTPSDYTVMLSDNQSHIVYHASFNISQKNQVFLLDLPSSIAAGMYYVIVMDKKAKKQYTEKLIVQ
jgi:hypothetical protein